MSAIYSSFRDVSGIITPGVAWLVLLAAPLSAIFAAGGAALGLAWAVAGSLHLRLGQPRSVALRPVAAVGLQPGRPAPGPAKEAAGELGL